MDYIIFVISHNRPENVKKMEEFIGLPCTWVVGKDEGLDYISAGAKNVIEGGSLVESRNMALEIAKVQNKICIQLSDDLKRIQLLSFPDKKKKDITFPEALKMFLDEIKRTPFKLYGVPPTPNEFFVHKPRSLNVFIIGDFMVIKPSTVFFDAKLKLKEDYDYTAQHIKTYGGVLRFDTILCTFSHYSNKGGAVDVRTNELEQEMIQHIMTKHKGMFRLNPKRENEILLKRLK